MEAKDWLNGVEKKLAIAQCMDREKVLFAARQLFGMAANWWETYFNTHSDVDSIMWNEFKAHFCNHYVPYGTMKQKKKEFANLRQGSMTINEYLKTHSFNCPDMPLKTSTLMKRSRTCFWKD
jgi:hypothetical protein